jgi:hypothetical protein
MLLPRIEGDLHLGPAGMQALYSGRFVVCEVLVTGLPFASLVARVVGCCDDCMHS